MWCYPREKVRINRRVLPSKDWNISNSSLFSFSLTTIAGTIFIESVQTGMRYLEWLTNSIIIDRPRKKANFKYWFTTTISLASLVSSDHPTILCSLLGSVEGVILRWINYNTCFAFSLAELSLTLPLPQSGDIWYQVVQNDICRGYWISISHC